MSNPMHEFMIRELLVTPFLWMRGYAEDMGEMMKVVGTRGHDPLCPCAHGSDRPVWCHCAAIPYIKAGLLAQVNELVHWSDSGGAEVIDYDEVMKLLGGEK